MSICKMNWRTGAAAVAVLMSVACGGAAQKKTSAETSQGGRVIALSDSALMQGVVDTIGFGRMSSGEMAVKEVWLENRTSRPLVISQLKRNCGCVTMDYESRPVLRGERLKLQVTFDSRGEWGWQLKVADVCFAGFERTLRLYVDADIR